MFCDIHIKISDLDEVNGIKENVMKINILIHNMKKLIENFPIT